MGNTNQNIQSKKFQNIEAKTSHSQNKIDSNPDSIQNIPKIPDIQTQRKLIQNTLDKYLGQEEKLQEQWTQKNKQMNEKQMSDNNQNKEEVTKLQKILLKKRNVSDMIDSIKQCQIQIQNQFQKRSSKINSSTIKQYSGITNVTLPEQNQLFNKINSKILANQKLYQQNLSQINQTGLLNTQKRILYLAKYDKSKKQAILMKRNQQQKLDMLWRQFGGRYKDILMSYKQLTEGKIQTLKFVYKKLSILHNGQIQKILDLSQRTIRSQFLCKIRNFKWQQVQVLHLNFCNISDPQWKTLVEILKQFKSLKLLSLYGNHIKNIEYEHLEQLPKSLQYVDFTHQKKANKLNQQSIKNLNLYKKNNPSIILLFDNSGQI